MLKISRLLYKRSATYYKKISGLDQYSKNIFLIIDMICIILSVSKEYNAMPISIQYYNKNLLLLVYMYGVIIFIMIL